MNAQARCSLKVSNVSAMSSEVIGQTARPLAKRRKMVLRMPVKLESAEDGPAGGVTPGSAVPTSPVSVAPPTPQTAVPQPPATWVQPAAAAPVEVPTPPAMVQQTLAAAEASLDWSAYTSLLVTCLPLFPLLRWSQLPHRWHHQLRR